jgi:hypothetical protein
MADSIRETILQAIVSRLVATTGISGRVYRSRAEMVARGEMPAIIVQPLTATPTQQTSACKIDKVLSVAILICIHADIPDQAADPIITDAHKRLMPTVNGFVDLTLGDLPGVQDIAEAGETFKIEAVDGVIALTYEVKYRHAQGDPTAL